MNRKSARICMVFYIMLMFFLCYGEGIAAIEVQAKGMSFFEPGREAIARERAIDEAKRAALEKAVGATIESRIALENAQVIMDTVFSRSSGYLRNIQIIDERQTVFGTYEVTIKAEVELADMVSDLDRFQEALSWQRNPRVSIMIEPGVNKEHFFAATKAVNMLSDRLKQNGFTVFRHSKVEEAQMGLLLGLSLEHSAILTRVHNSDITLNEISLTTSIYRPVDGEILATAGSVRSAPGENRMQIIDQATRNCIDDVWKELTQKITIVWEKELHAERLLNFILNGVADIGEASQIAAMLKANVSGVIDSSLITFNDQKADYIIRYRGWPEQFLNEIQMSYFKHNFGNIILQNISGNRIEAEWGGSADQPSQ